MKKIINIALMLVLVLTLTACSKDKKEENKVKENTNPDVISDKTVEVFEFRNTSLTYTEEGSVLETNVTNNSDENEYLKEFIIHIRENDTEYTLTGYVGNVIKAHESILIRSTHYEDLTNATSITYEVVR